MGFEAIRVCSGVVEGFPVVQVAICHFSVRGVQNVGGWRTRSSRIPCYLCYLCCNLR